MERSVGEIFFDGNTKLVVRRAANSISCKGCFYERYEIRNSYSIPQVCNEKGCTNAVKHDCKHCPLSKHEKTGIWVCRRNLVVVGLCQATFRDDGESVIFAEVCE